MQPWRTESRAGIDMIFDDESKTMMFPLTSVGKNFWRGRRFLTKKELMYAIRNWKIFPLINGVCITNVICDKWGPALAQDLWLDLLDTENIVSSLAEISLSHGIIHIGSSTTKDNCIGVAKTANHQTNIDADVIDAIVKKLGGNARRLEVVPNDI